MRKIYEYRNKAEAELVISTSAAKFKYRFSGGIMDPKNKIHARHMTDNIVMQKVLENSEYFNKVIFLVDTFDSPETSAPLVRKAKAVGVSKDEKVETPKKGADKPKDGTKKGGTKVKTEDKPAEEITMSIVEDVTDMGAAASYLISEGYANAEDLMTPEGVMKAAKELNISFPNLK